MYAGAVAAPTTLTATLNAAAFASSPQVLAGKQVVEAQANGIATRYQFPVGMYALQAQDVAAMWSRLLDLYDQSQVSTTNVPPGGGLAPEAGPGPSSAIYQWMLGQLQVIRAFSTDFSTSLNR